MYLLNISGNDFNQTEKLMLSDGGKRYVNVLLSSGASYLSKKMDNELLIEFRRNGFEEKDTVINISPNITLNAELIQIPTVESIHFFTEQTLVPTNTPADNTYVDGEQYFNGWTNNNGEFEADFLVEYIENPLDPNDKRYTPQQITLYIARTNTTSDPEIFTIDGSDISWINDLQQTPIHKLASAFGGVIDENGDLGNALVQIFDAGTNEFKDSTRSTPTGFWTSSYWYDGYENDDNDLYALIDSVRFEFSAVNHLPFDTTVIFANAIEVIAFLPQIPVEPYVFNATIELRKTNQGQMITDLDTIWFNWKNGEPIEAYLPVNGVLNVHKEMTTVSADTTAEMFHIRPDLYMNWMIGHRVNPERGDWMFQNPSYTENSTFSMNEVNQEGTIEVYLVPEISHYGPNNDIPMSMRDVWIQAIFQRSAAYVSGFRPSPAGWDTTDILQFTFNLDTNDPVPQTHLDRAFNEMNKFMTATHWPHKNLLVYRFTEIDSVNDPYLQNIINGPRNWDNFTFSMFYNAGAGNSVNIATDGTFRIKYSNSGYNINNTQGDIQEEFLASATNTEFDGMTYFWDSNSQYTDVAQNVIGITNIFHPGTQYLGVSPEKNKD